MLEAIVSRWPDEASWLFGLKENDIATDYRSVTLAAAHAYRYISQNKLRLSSSQFGNLVTQFFKLVKDSATLPADISETEKWIIADEILEMGGIPFLEEELEHEKKRAEDDNQIEAWGRKQR